jgi:hypothetical protein
MYNVGDIFLGDDLRARITGCRKVKLLLKDGRITALSRVFHIPELARNLISISKMNDIGLHVMFERETYKMV